AMLAGALLNRGSDILTTIVDLEEAGIKIESNNELLRECGKCFLAALEFGKNIKLYSGGEGLDELWGEPFKVFSMPMDEFFQSRYIKVAQTMSEIDQITETLIKIIKHVTGFDVVESIVIELGESAKQACETLRSDPVICDVWPRYVAAKETLENYISDMTERLSSEEHNVRHNALGLIQEGGSLLVDLTTVRVPMPKSTKQFYKKCDKFILTK
ncbi:MAG: hypothetical protein V3V89_00320, partial [Gammaproteobacteria bacterium]